MLLCLLEIYSCSMCFLGSSLAVKFDKNLEKNHSDRKLSETKVTKKLIET